MDATNKPETVSAAGSSPVNRDGPSVADWFSAWRFAVLLALGLTAAFPLVVVGARAFVFRDYGVLAYPFAFYQRHCFWQGELPLWNPLSNCGAPFLGQWGTMGLYPLALVYLLLPMPWALGIFCLGHLWLGGVGMFLLARRWTGNSFGASIAGLTFVFNGVTLSCLIWPNYTVALGWMPWVVLLTERAWREGGRGLVAATVISALQLLAGVPEITVLTWLFVMALWVGGLQISDFRFQIEGRRLARLVGILTLVGGLTAAQTLPFLDLLAHSQRHTGFATARWTLPGWGWGNFLVPLFHCFETYQGVFFQHEQEFFSSVYLGLGPLMLAILGASQVRRQRVGLLAGIALLSIILALGDHGFLYAWLRSWIPALGFARFPVKFLVLTLFTVPLLAAFAVAWFQPTPPLDRRLRESLCSSGEDGRLDPGESSPCSEVGRGIAWRSVAATGTLLGLMMAAVLWFAYRYPFPLDQWAATWHGAAARVVFVVLMWVCLAGSLRSARPKLQRAAQLATLLVLALDLLTHAPAQNPTVPAEVFAPGLNELKPPPRIGEGRVMISPLAEEHLLHSRVRSPRDDFIGKRLALWSNLNALDGIPKVNGSSTLQLREQAEVQALLYATPKTDLPRLADFLSATHITAPGTVVEWTNRATALPWVTTGQQPVFADATHTLRALTAPDFDPRRVVYLPLEAKPSIRAVQAANARILTTRVTAERIEVDVEAAGPSLVVISQSFYHNWRAYVDGTRVPLWRANHAFQALEVPGGRHQVELAYVDRWFEAGALISAATLLVLAAVWIRSRCARGSIAEAANR